MCSELSGRPDVLDIGCGPGMHTIALARMLDGRVAAGDLHQELLDQLVELDCCSLAPDAWTDLKGGD